MAQSRYYSATAQPTVLTSAITPTTTVINVQQTVGFPVNTPYILALDYNTPSEEITLVTAQAGTTLTVTRSYDGTSASSHSAGAAVRHTWTALDGNDSRAHEAATAGVHGVTGNVVGDTDTQTLSNKTLVSPVITGSLSMNSPNITGTVTGAATYVSPTIRDATAINSAVGVSPLQVNAIASTTANLFGVNLSASDRLTVTANGQTLATSRDVATTALIARSQTGQTASIVRVQLGAGTDVVTVTNTGVLRAIQGLQAGTANQVSIDNAGNITTGSQATLSPSAVGNVPLTVKGLASQTGDLQRWTSSTPTTLASIDSAGVGHFTSGLQAGSTNQFAVDASGNLAAANNITMGTWINYSPSWTATTNPSLGNGNLGGRYMVIGKTCTVEITLQWGSTTTGGTGTWLFSLPFTAVTPPTNNFHTGTAMAFRPGTAFNPGISTIGSGATTLSGVSSTAADGSASTGWTATTPFTWANTHTASFAITYQTT